MLHIFLSNRPATCATAPPASRSPATSCAWSTTTGAPVAPGEVGRAAGQRPDRGAGLLEQPREEPRHLPGPWTRSGDKYSIDADGHYVYAGRTDDMLKVGGIYVSPFEVEAALITHPAVLEAAVVGQRGRRPADQADGLRRAEARPDRARERWPRSCSEHVKIAARAVQVSALDRVRGRAAEDRDRQDPALQAAQQGQYRRGLLIPGKFHSRHRIRHGCGKIAPERPPTGAGSFTYQAVTPPLPLECLLLEFHLTIAEGTGLNRPRVFLNWLLTPVTILMVPHSRTKPISIRVPVLALASSVCLFLLGASVVVAMSVRAVEHQRMKEQALVPLVAIPRDE